MQRSYAVSNPYMHGVAFTKPGCAMPTEPQKPRDVAILIWVPPGETPTAQAFDVRGASTFAFLSDAIIHAQKDAADRPDKPWISTSDVMFGPDQIRVLAATIMSKGAS